MPDGSEYGLFPMPVQEEEPGRTCNWARRLAYTHHAAHNKNGAQQHTLCHCDTTAHNLCADTSCFFGVDKFQELRLATENHPPKGPAREGCNPTGTHLRRQRYSAVTTWFKGQHLAVQPAQGRRQGPAMHMQIQSPRTVHTHTKQCTTRPRHGKPRYSTPPTCFQHTAVQSASVRQTCGPSPLPPPPACRLPRPQPLRCEVLRR